MDEVSKDKASDLGEDLREIAGLTAEESATFVEIVENLKSGAVAKYKTLRTRKSYEAGVLPSLSGVANSVEFRAVTEEAFKLGAQPEEYKPKLVGHVPVISIRLKVDSGHVGEFVFQASPEELQLLIDSLNAALVEIKAFEKHLGIEPEVQDD